MVSVERFKTIVRDLCGLLLCVSDDKVYLLHQTVRTFLVPEESPEDKPSVSNGTLTWEKSFPRHKSNSVLGKICVWSLHSDLSGTDFDRFLAYASLNWYIHLQAFLWSDDKEAEKIQCMAVQLCTPGSIKYERWSASYYLQTYDARIPEDATSLITASWLGISGAVEKILQDGLVSKESTDSKLGRSALSWAAKHGHPDVVKLLLEKGADFNAKDSKGRTPLLFAAKKGYSDIVKLLLKKEAQVDLQDHSGRTPLMAAARKGQRDVVKLLLEAKADVHLVDNSRRTPLSHAVFRGDFDIVKLLLETEAYVNASDCVGQTPLSYAAAYDQSDVMASWFDAGAGLPAESDYSEIVELLIEKGADVELRDKDQDTPLLLAVRHGCFNVVKLILDFGAELDVKDKYQHTLLSLVAARGYSEIMRILLKEEAEGAKKSTTNVWDEGQETPLSHAAASGHFDAVKLLLETNANVHLSGENGRTPFSYAAGNGHCDIVELLLVPEFKAEVDSRDQNQRTPLSHAAGRGRSDVVELLLEAGAMFDPQDINQRTPLSYATEGNHCDVVKLFLDAATKSSRESVTGHDYPQTG
ncbi:hypothetical protein N7493_011913 [Penicillium malachiteum]|uniref:Uncharacterized protein n=1 Tax=Penicillium malachiteum TaxID=1324776 RepID=A0AAD6H9W4_9EURO|nr:hypothetical protein N7493_011913 [Penicillium malachiteum]